MFSRGKEKDHLHGIDEKLLSKLVIISPTPHIMDHQK